MEIEVKNEAISVPELQLAQYQFILINGPKDHVATAQQALDKAIKDDSLTFIYKQTCEMLGVQENAVLIQTMEAENKKVLEELDEKIKAAEELGDLELTSAMIAKAEYFAKIGDKNSAIALYTETADRSTTTFNHKLNISFGLLHLGFFYMDTKLVQKQIEKAKELVDRGGDWERRNRLKAYECIWWTYHRDFNKASKLFLECLSTFASPELMSFQEFIKIGCVVCALSLGRADLKNKIISSPEVLEVIVDAPDISLLLNSLYDCKYAEFFQGLASIEQAHLKTSRYLYLHYRYYTKEMRIKAYAQLLQSYRSLTLSSMASSFGVTEEFIDRDLSRFIVAGRLHCVIDKVAGVVETNRPDKKNDEYQATIKQGDLLLNRIQKLSRVINI
ncbi:hypothetical protein BB559_001992 [Furculomyces boomerangus]|uniref:PCI domain-containing protein n=2 Tax=Harpellales TaxID=61421 RepID=A0A2T9YZ14_9FUNG|nr:hypothetical protein BB559_001992 [Furculomyces boomerangus]PVZ96937.1 hypothetical protein BB558_007138 [Smittium angustum]PVZ98210.1 hypothetical protein BB558_005785 [Smittium angustum]